MLNTLPKHQKVKSFFPTSSYFRCHGSTLCVLFCFSVVVCVPFVYLFRVNVEKLNSILWLLLLLFRRYRASFHKMCSVMLSFIYFYSPTFLVRALFLIFLSKVSLVPSTRKIDKKLDIHLKIANKIHLDSFLSSAYRTPSADISPKKLLVRTNATHTIEAVYFLFGAPNLIKDIIEQFPHSLCVRVPKKRRRWWSRCLIPSSFSLQFDVCLHTSGFISLWFTFRSTEQFAYHWISSIGFRFVHL